MKKITILAFVGMCFPILLLSQSIVVTQDFGIWSGLEVTKKISKHLDFALEQQVRFYSDAKVLDDYFVDLGGKYDISKNFALGLNLRYIYNKRRWNNTEHNLRYNFDINYKFKALKKIKLYYRFRHQENTTISVQPISFPTKMMAFRHRLKIKYTICHYLDLYNSMEFFRYTENLSLPYWGKCRINLGGVVKTKYGDFDLSAGIEKELCSATRLTFYYLKTIYSYSL